MLCLASKYYFISVVKKVIRKYWAIRHSLIGSFAKEIVLLVNEYDDGACCDILSVARKKNGLN
jgi:hypothetical protein